MAPAVTRKTNHTPRGGRSSQTTCKTCTSCRQKKVKCDGVRPQCHECASNGLDCVFPRDARREPRPSKARIQNLEAAVAAMLEHMKASGISPPTMETMPTVNLMQGSSRACHASEPEPEPEHGDGDGDVRALTPGSMVSTSMPLPTPCASTTTNVGMDSQLMRSPMDFTGSTNMRRSSFDLGSEGLPAVSPPPPNEHRHDHNSQAEYPNNIPSETQPDNTATTPGVATGQRNNGSAPGHGLSPCEARVAGVYHEHGCVSSVHGLSGIINPTRRAQHKANISKVSRKGEAAVIASKAWLISNAALQRQGEARIFRQPQQTIDLDGCDPELARHLIDLHFNRNHCAYLISYRPAIMDSIANRGPWVNKLLLNAIYFSSSLYSDRQCLRSSAGNPQDVGGHFYHRFRHLLIDEMERPSVPSAVALLLTSATLVSQGKVSAGWTLSGTAYRMILDLGCHLMLGSDYQEASTNDNSNVLGRDVEHEMRKRLYWGAYITDVTQSLYLGRSCSFASTEARVPMRLLDTFEELEDWHPYVDPADSNVAGTPPYTPQPSHAVSTFGFMIKLMQTGALISELYGIQTVQCDTGLILEKKNIVEIQLEKWTNSLPDHLRFDPDGPRIPPPHQITPHTTFHVFRILLYRAFLEDGHLHRHSDAEAKKLFEEKCIESALMIEKYIRAYRNAFTLRRAPFLLSYAIYSAVATILPQERHDRGQFTEIISFFWTCLGELQRGCNFGLQKPLSILRDMVYEFHLSAQDREFRNAQNAQFAGLDKSFFPQLPLTETAGGEEEDTSMLQGATPQQPLWDMLGGDYDPSSPGLLEFLNDQEWDIGQNTLYGLFAPNQALQ